uniref:IF rod domain-containing protein n=1 Tax=Echeneis naucrates TaxID=173247 RepID=A0A665SYQ7_ECHNA
MELHGVHKTFHSSHLGEEKQQMLSLNRRLETYLNRVKLLEEENMLLAREITALRHGSHGAKTRRKGLEEELRQTRLELDAAWRDRVYTELEVGRLAEEVQTLDQQRQKEAQAHLKAKTMLEQSRRELKEEERAQIWLREKVGQLEHEMRHLIQTHQEDVASMEAAVTHSRATAQSTWPQRANQAPNLLQLGQEYSQRATRAWQEAAEAYQGQLSQIEESLHQAKSRLTQVSQEKGESQLRLRALEKEIASAQDVRLHLEKATAQQRDQHRLEIQELQVSNIVSG